jgi:hypothetical protein
MEDIRPPRKDELCESQITSAKGRGLAEVVPPGDWVHSPGMGLVFQYVKDYRRPRV